MSRQSAPITENVRRGRRMLSEVRETRTVVTPLLVSFLLVVGVGSAAGKAFLPPPGKIFQGEAGQPISSYVSAVGKHPAVYQEFLAWGQYVPGITPDALNARSRLMIMISTRSGSQEMITPGRSPKAGGISG